MLHLARNLKLIRKLSGLTQPSFGNKFDATKSMVISYEQARAEPDELYIERVAKFASISEDDLKNKRLTVEELTKVPKVQKVYAEATGQPLSAARVKIDLQDYIELLAAQKEKAEKEKEEYLALIGNQINLIREVLAPIGNTSIAILNYQKAWVDFFSEVHAKGDKKEEERLIRRMNNIVDGKASGGVLAGMDPAAGKLSKKKKP